MRPTSRLAAVLASLSFSTGASAADAPRLGLGVSVETTLLGSLVPLGNAVLAPPVQLYVPIAVTPSFRLEPAFGLTTVTDKGSVPEVTSDSISLGIGALYVRPVAAQVQLLAGARFTAIWSSDQVPDEDAPQPTLIEAEQRNLVFALVLGGEYLPTPWFSVGLEGQLSLANLGDVDLTRESDGATTRIDGGSSVSTNALVFLRVYFL
jgi:hypothetical protein